MKPLPELDFIVERRTVSSVGNINLGNNDDGIVTGVLSQLTESNTNVRAFVGLALAVGLPGLLCFKKKQ